MRKVFSVAAALSVSLFVYLFYRSEKTVVNELIVMIFSFDTYAAVKNSITNAFPLNKHIIFSLPGGLWIFSATVLSQGFYMKAKDHELHLSVAPIFFAIGLEFCQLIHLTNGRFDVWDIASYLFFWLIAYYSFQSRGSQQNILSPLTLRGFFCLVCFLSVYLAHVNR